MDGLGTLFLRVCIVSAGSSAVLAPLLLLAPKIQKRVAARSFYVLFLLLALRLILPVELKLPAPAVTVPAPDYTVSLPVQAAHGAAALPSVRPAAELPAAEGEAAPAGTPRQSGRTVPVVNIFGAVWGLGAALCAILSVVRYALARRRLLRGAVPAGAGETRRMEHQREQLGVKRRVRLMRSENAPTPLALGLFRPVIVLPVRCGHISVLVLRHELTHIRRWDVAYKVVLSLACWVNWFNPLVWLMDRAAGRNLELCCDDDVVRGLSNAERQQYGRMLLDEAAVRPITFSTCFAGGKTQMKERLLNLFAQKRNSAALVCLVLAAALLAGGLVSCERAEAEEANGPSASSPLPQPTLSPENAAQRALLKEYFYENFTEDSASVVLADLTGDDLDEMLVITMGMDADFPRAGMEVDFTYGAVSYYMVRDGAVVRFSGSTDVSNSHAGWGYVYLVPNPAGAGCAILDFRPYIGQGQASYAYSISTLGADGAAFTVVEQGDVFFQLDLDSMMGMDMEGASTQEEVREFLDRVDAFRESGVPLLAYNESFDRGEVEFACLDLAPADVFGGAAAMHLPSLREHAVCQGGPISFPLPAAAPATPEEALDALEQNLQPYPDGYVFRVPGYDGAWDIHIAGRMRMDGGEDSFMSVHFLDGEEWTPGRRYSFDTGEGAWFSELTLTARVTGPDGTSAERTLLLEKDGESAWVRPADLAAQAFQDLTGSIRGLEDGFTFTLPEYDGTWELNIDGRMRMDAMSHPYDPEQEDPPFLSVHYLEDEVWESGRTYFIETGDAWFEELTLTVTVRAIEPGGTQLERCVLLASASAAPGEWGDQK